MSDRRPAVTEALDLCLTIRAQMPGVTAGAAATATPGAEGERKLGRTSGSCVTSRRRGTVGAWALALVLQMPASVVLAQVYKVTDEENGVTFTDRPQDLDGGTVEKIEIRETNTTAPPVAPRERRSRELTAPSEPAEATPPQAITITSPGDESTVAMGPGNFTVSARAEPPLASGERLVLMIDGQAFGAEQTRTSWFVEGAMRGPHDLVVRRLSAAGETVATSEPVRVYVLRPSIIRR